ncbi:MAG: 50S ribosomal protein L6 [Bacilli bacterium]
MSRIGNKILLVPSSVTVTINDNRVTVKGPKGELTRVFSKNIIIKLEENKLTTERKNNKKETKQLHGTTNSVIKNMIQGVTEGFEKNLEIIGVGYRFQPKGKTLGINAGFSHPVELKVPEGIEVEGISSTELKIKGIDNVLVGEFAASIRKIRQPEPYKGKGIRYKDEYVRRKEGKKAA